LAKFGVVNDVVEEKMNNDIKNVRFVEMTFDHTIAFDIQEIADANTPIGEPVASCVTRLMVGRYATLTYN
jgi:hypothetical protein